VLFLLDCETLHTLTFSETSAEKTKLSTVLRLLQKASKTHGCKSRPEGRKS